jgi:hypothetical protein
MSLGRPDVLFFKSMKVSGLPLCFGSSKTLGLALQSGLLAVDGG